jgi:hypothetical protein
MAIFHSYFDITRGYQNLEVHHQIPRFALLVLVPMGTAGIKSNISNFGAEPWSGIAHAMPKNMNS